MTPPGVTVLPLQVWDQPAGPVLRCLCGAEASTLRCGPQLGPDLTPAAVAIMTAHARICTEGFRRLEELTGLSRRRAAAAR